MSKLPHTSETSIAITFLVMNLSVILRQIFCLFYAYFEKPNIWAILNCKKLYFSELNIIKNYLFPSIEKAVILA